MPPIPLPKQPDPTSVAPNPGSAWPPKPRKTLLPKPIGVPPPVPENVPPLNEPLGFPPEIPVAPTAPGPMV